MQILNPFEQIFNRLLTFTMLGDITWHFESVEGDLLFSTNWQEFDLHWVAGDNFINFYGESNFVLYITPTNVNQLLEVLTNDFDWNTLP